MTNSRRDVGYQLDVVVENSQELHYEARIVRMFPFAVHATVSHWQLARLENLVKAYAVRGDQRTVDLLLRDKRHLLNGLIGQAVSTVLRQLKSRQRKIDAILTLLFLLSTLLYSIGYSWIGMAVDSVLVVCLGTSCYVYAQRMDYIKSLIRSAFQNNLEVKLNG